MNRLLITASLLATFMLSAEPLKLNTRARALTAVSGGKYEPVLREVQWDPKKTAVIVCDMWDDHWCKGAAARVGEMTPRMDEVLRTMRQRGVFVVHAPSTVTDFYKDTPQRKRAQTASTAKPPVPLETKHERWGTCWLYPDPDREPANPIDDTDMGCDCKVKCKIEPPWKRQIAGLSIGPDDAITDSGAELWNLLAARGITQIVFLGVHTNMCVLGRPFAIRQLVKLGLNVVLVRDLTDTMYNSAMRPFVSHYEGTELVVQHIEKYWCPTITSTDLVGKPAFRFKEDPRAGK